MRYKRRKQHHILKKLVMTILAAFFIFSAVGIKEEMQGLNLGDGGVRRAPLSAGDVSGNTALEDDAAGNSPSGNNVSDNNVDRQTVTLDNIPDYTDSPYIELNHNIPSFTEDDLMTTSWESYSDLDRLKRCGVANACIGRDIMPTEERGAIGMVRPSGWHTVKYSFIDGNYLYNRCHLIGYQLAGENANEKNLITGTRYLNVTGMLPFENEVAYYVEDTGNHVRYRVTPVFEGNNLVASGVQMEAESVEDDGYGVCFNVYVYNVQPGVYIDYFDGDSEEE